MATIAVRRLAGLALALGLACAGSRATAAAGPLPSSFSEIARAPAGGTVWQGLIPDPGIPALSRPTVVYLPPGFPNGGRYPVAYLLQGFAGSPYEYVDGLNLPQAADDGIARHELQPFIGVVPPAGLDAHHGDWTGVWERYLVRDVVPWVDAHLPAVRKPGGRMLGGLSAGGYGAVDIGLRHPLLFRTLESWSGYFTPLRAGALVHADPAQFRAHDPSALVRREAALLRRVRTRFFLSSGTTHDAATAEATRTFARELGSLALPFRLWLGPGGHNGLLWRAQLPAALRYAFPG